MIEKKFETIKIYSDMKAKISGNSLTVLEKRYLARNERGDIIETAEELFSRVARFVASADSLYGASDEEITFIKGHYITVKISFCFQFYFKSFILVLSCT